jgi:MYXO-CTERM domain-containing protein
MKLKIASVLIALASSSYGALVTLSSFAETYNGQDDYGILLSTGVPVAPGAGLASVIVFSSLTDTQVADLAAAQDYATLFAPANFVTITSDDFTGIAGAFGATAGFVSAGITGYVPALVNKTLYAYITSGSELGLFKSNSTLVADPAPPALENTYNVRFSDGTAIIGSFGPDYNVPTYVGGGPATVNSFQLVPEPSAALLGALGALGLLRRRRN